MPSRQPDHLIRPDGNAARLLDPADTWGNQAISRAVHERSAALAASTWAVCEALVQAAVRCRHQRQPPVYANLCGRGGLATDDAAWKALVDVSDASKLLTFTTGGIALATVETAQLGVVWSGQPSTGAGAVGVVCFRAARDGRQSRSGNFRTLVAVGSGRYALPPFARVTLEKVEEGGEWSLSWASDGQATKCRLYTVSVDW